MKNNFQEQYFINLQTKTPERKGWIKYSVDKKHSRRRTPNQRHL